jgi:hypothetical protein
MSSSSYPVDPSSATYFIGHVTVVPRDLCLASRNGTATGHGLGDAAALELQRRAASNLG